MYIYTHDRSSQKSEQGVVDCVELEEQVIVSHSVIAGN